MVTKQQKNQQHKISQNNKNLRHCNRIKHAKRMTFSDQIIDWSIVQRSGNNQHNIVNHVCVSLVIFVSIFYKFCRQQQQQQKVPNKLEKLL
jgi:F0F1-type ATP synthase membrane subunit a